MINTQFWVATFFNEYEAWSNYRRHRLSCLDAGNLSRKPISWRDTQKNGNIQQWINKLTSANYNAAVAGLPGGDKITSRMWWDVP